jgi:hypothetical protein
MKKEIYLLETCDIWKSNRRAFGVYSSLGKLKNQLKKMIKDNSIEIDMNCPLRKNLVGWTANDLHNNINYISISTGCLNEEI